MRWLTASRSVCPHCGRRIATAADLARHRAESPSFDPPHREPLWSVLICWERRCSWEGRPHDVATRIMRIRAMVAAIEDPTKWARANEERLRTERMINAPSGDVRRTR